MTTPLNNWAPYTNYVQGGMVDGNYVSAQFTMLAAGPPRLAMVGGANAFPAEAAAGQLTANSGITSSSLVMPMGVIQSFGLNNSRQINRIFEIGSQRSYFIAGHTVGQLSLGRAYYHGASFLRLLYAYFTDRIGSTQSNAAAALHQGFSSDNVQVPPMYMPALTNINNPHDVVIPPGYENLFINLASDMFSQPIGLMMYMHDVNMKLAIGANYFESCFVPNHGISTDAQGVLYQEQVGLQFERIVPVRISGAQLIAPANGNADNSGNNIANAATYGFPSY